MRYVIHYNMPKSLEAYYQEAGRAGRDGEAADCILLFYAGDVHTAQFLIENSGENDALSEEDREEIQRQERFRLNRMIDYCKTENCLRGNILDYFGQTHPETCGNCSNCLAERETVDVTREAQIILSCVARIRQRLGYDVGSALVNRTLRGSKEKRVEQLGLDKLSTYGLLGSESRDTVQVYMEGLERLGYLRTDPVHRGIGLTNWASVVLFHGERVQLRLQRARAQERRETARSKTQKAASRVPQPVDSSVFEALRTLRREIADREGVPAYVVFSDATLRDMSSKLPQTEAAMLQISGVGDFKLRKYGTVFLQKLRELV